MALKSIDVPMTRHLANPIDATVLHWDVSVQALGDSVGNDGLPLLLQQCDQAPLFIYKIIDLDYLSI
ncbi:hypothetical protein NS230_04950 [Methylobacterium indicum]|nr:hypothetical protein NS230_04950 [Methylobacterium indicum]